MNTYPRLVPSLSAVILCGVAYGFVDTPLAGVALSSIGSILIALGWVVTLAWITGMRAISRQHDDHISMEKSAVFCFRLFVWFTLIGLLISFPLVVRDPTQTMLRAECAGNLRAIYAAIQSYRQEHGEFPPSRFRDDPKGHWRSWRVLLIPYLDIKAPYTQYHPDEDWDGLENRGLATQAPSVFRCPCGDVSCSEKTSYVMVSSEDIAPSIRSNDDSEMGEVALSDTILVVEIDNSDIIWLEPRDFRLTDIASMLADPESTIKCGCSGSRTHVLFADGHVQLLDKVALAECVRRMLGSP